MYRFLNIYCVFLFCFHSFYIYAALPFHFITMTQRLNWSNFLLFVCPFLAFLIPSLSSSTSHSLHPPYLLSPLSFSFTPSHFYVSKAELIGLVILYRIYSVKKLWNAPNSFLLFSFFFAFSHKQFKTFKYYGLCQCHFQFILYERLLHIFVSFSLCFVLVLILYVENMWIKKNLPKLSPLLHWKFLFFYLLQRWNARTKK